MADKGDLRRKVTFEASELGWMPGQFRNAIVVNDDTVILTKVMRDREGEVEGWKYENPRMVVTVFND